MIIDTDKMKGWALAHLKFVVSGALWFCSWTLAHLAVAQTTEGLQFYYGFLSVVFTIGAIGWTIYLLIVTFDLWTA